MSAAFTLKVGGLHTIGAVIPAFQPTHLLGILDPLTPEPPIYGHEPEKRTTLLLRFHDINEGEPAGPAVDHVQQIIAFIDEVRAAGRQSPARLLVHCHAGISRSTASAYIALARDLGVDRAGEAFRRLLRVTANPWPNHRLVRLADEALAANGRLLAPLDAYRSANIDRLQEMMAYHQLLMAAAPAGDTGSSD